MRSMSSESESLTHEEVRIIRNMSAKHQTCPRIIFFKAMMRSESGDSSSSDELSLSSSIESSSSDRFRAESFSWSSSSDDGNRSAGSGSGSGSSDSSSGFRNDSSGEESSSS